MKGNAAAVMAFGIVARHCGTGQAATGFVHPCVQGERGVPSIRTARVATSTGTISVSIGDYDSIPNVFVASSMDVQVTGSGVNIPWRVFNSSNIRSPIIVEDEVH